MEENYSEQMTSLGDEYKILQDKIDKIGGFRVTIKGWSVTAAVAGLVAVATSKGFSPVMTAVALDVLLVCFLWLEREQVRLGWKFNARARIIEVQIDRLRRTNKRNTSFATPNIARSLFGLKKKKDLISYEFEWNWAERIRLYINGQFRLALSSHVVFYAVLVTAAWLPTWIPALFKVSPQPVDVPTVVIHNELLAPAKLTSAEALPSQVHLDKRKNQRKGVAR